MGQSKTLKHLRSEGAAFVRQEYFRPRRIPVAAPDSDQAKAGFAISPAITDTLHVPSHDVAVQVQLLGIPPHRLTFFQGRTDLDEPKLIML